MKGDVTKTLDQLIPCFAVLGLSAHSVWLLIFSGSQLIPSYCKILIACSPERKAWFTAWSEIPCEFPSHLGLWKCVRIFQVAIIVLFFCWLWYVMIHFYILSPKNCIFAGLLWYDFTHPMIFLWYPHWWLHYRLQALPCPPFWQQSLARPSCWAMWSATCWWPWVAWAKGRGRPGNGRMGLDILDGDFRYLPIVFVFFVRRCLVCWNLGRLFFLCVCVFSPGATLG
jgi:hypothetical protein